MTGAALSAEVLGRVRDLGRERALVVLDDDPTGTQTIRGLEVLTSWAAPVLQERLASSRESFFVLTNSRSLPQVEAAAIARTIGQCLAAVGHRTGRQVSVVSRSDSTLRGHFPAEVDALAAGLERPDARILLAPYFGDGGRITVDEVHMLRTARGWTPVGETEFARDPAFGYRASQLRDWIAERGAGDRAVHAVSLERLRSVGPDAVAATLADLPPAGICIVNAAEETDIELVALGALQAELAGTPLIARTAASYVRARCGQARHGLLTDDELAVRGIGLIVVGSHVPTTTLQLDALRQARGEEIVLIELHVSWYVGGDAAGGDAALRSEAEASRAIDLALAKGKIPVLFSSRRLAGTGDPSADLVIASSVSAGLVRVVAGIRRKPDWIIAKGGITSSDIATGALGLERAIVTGQVQPGVSVWRCGARSRWPGLPYVVFPGNVGGPDALHRLVERLTVP